MLKTGVSLAALSAVAKAAGQQTCAQYGIFTNGPYIVNNNLWNGTNGGQCTTVNSISDAGVSFQTNWNWTGPPDWVRSYANAGLNSVPGPKVIDDIASVPTAVKWSYNTPQAANADVSYDLFTAANASHPRWYGDYELMIWLGKFGNIAPIGKPQETINIGTNEFTVWYGKNPTNGMQTYSFVATKNINDFSGDIKQFFNHLTATRQFPAEKQYLINLQFGTESFGGQDATMTATNFVASID